MIDNEEHTPPALDDDLDPVEEITEPAEEAAVTQPRADPRRRGWWAGFREFQRSDRKPLYTPLEAAGHAARYWLQPAAILNACLFILLTGYFIAQASVHWVAVIDDSYITFRFVDMFVNGYGWRFSPEGLRVEGFTNFLWAVSLIIPHMLGWDLMYVAKLMGLGCGVATMAASWGFARAVRNREDVFNLIPAALLAVNSYFSSWALMGMETLMQTALVTACYWRFEAERRNGRLWQLSPILALLAAMTRFDSLYYLSPLGVYGIWLVLGRRMTLRRLVTWALLAAIPFTVYTTWRITYFGDILPNTYYAKQRFVTGHARGLAHLETFYFGQGDFDYGKPFSEARLNSASGDSWAMELERRLYAVASADRPSLVWMNFWLISAVLCLVAMIVPWLLKWMRRQGEFLSDLHASKIFFLIVVPWLLNLYYVYHVDGDWMPCFRFMMVVLPFIGVAGAVGFGYVPQMIGAATDRRWPGWGAGLGLAVLAVYLLFGTAVEQARITSVSIFGPDSIYWASRQNFWWLPRKIESAYGRGFSPPLAEVSNYLLLETQDDSWIFMSDIGQPLWFATHLSLYDVDGLTDPFLAHAPSARGKLKTKEDHYQDLLRERQIKHPTPEQKHELALAAHRRHFEAHIKRNAEYVMDRRRPEYLLLFLNHSKRDPKSQGWPYPEISAAVYNHPNMKEYVEDAALPKIGNVFNHVYRRQDVKRNVPDGVKLERLFKTIERNPRMPYLIGLLYKESLKMEGIDPEDQRRIDTFVLDAMERWTEEPVVAEIARLAKHDGTGAVARDAIRKAIEKNPENADNYWSLAGVYEKSKEFQKAADVMWRADQRLGEEAGNSILYHVIWLSEKAENFADARKASELAVARNPKDTRAWSDYASMLDRSSRRPGLVDEERLALKRESLEKFERLVAELGEEPEPVAQTMRRLESEIAQLEDELGISSPAPEPPAPRRELRPEELSPPTPETRYQPQAAESYYR